MKMMMNRMKSRLSRADQNKLARFQKDESGSMVVFTLFVLILMLVVSGMAVDFMRFESRRSLMQGALDAGVLAAADLDQTADSKDVVRDYVTKSESGDCLTADPVVTESALYRKVEADCVLPLNTFYLRLIGIDQLNATASSVAVEGVGNVEVSLVLDVSGSMDDNITGTSTRKIDKLEDAALAFVDALLKPEYQDKVSLSLVPYSEHVNVGPELFNTLSVTQRHNYSHCVEIPAAGYTSTTWNNSLPVEQMQHYQFNSEPGNSSALTEPVCPQETYERIIPLSQNKTELNGAIAQLAPRAGTSIFLGLKWAVTLLDPSFKPNLNALPSGKIDAAFSDRPAAYTTSTTVDSTVKYVVLMTDGKNSSSSRLRDEYYATDSMIEHWANSNFWHTVAVYGGNYNIVNMLLETDVHTKSLGDGYMNSMCDAAKAKGIIIFSVAMGSSTSIDSTTMSNCASSPGHYFQTSGDELVSIFEAIAEQITDLRLTL